MTQVALNAQDLSAQMLWTPSQRDRDRVDRVTTQSPLAALDLEVQVSMPHPEGQIKGAWLICSVSVHFS